MDGDFFDDSLQDTSFYSSIKMYSSMADLDASSETDTLYEFSATPYQNVCFSMEDIHLTKKKTDAEKEINYCDLITIESAKNSRHKTVDDSKIEENCHKRSLPTNIVKPMVRQTSYHEMIGSNYQPGKEVQTKKFGYKVSKM
jgi:hypothetical protein